MKKIHKKGPTIDAVEIIHRRYYEGRPKRIAELAEAEANDTVARKIYELRRRAGLTQGQLAKLVGTTTSAISRLEDAGYWRCCGGSRQHWTNASNFASSARFVSRGLHSAGL